MIRRLLLVTVCIGLSGCTEEPTTPSGGTTRVIGTGSLQEEAPITVSQDTRTRIGNGQEYLVRNELVLERGAEATVAHLRGAAGQNGASSNRGVSVRLGDSRGFDVTLADGRTVKRDARMPMFQTRRMPDGRSLRAEASPEALARMAASPQSAGLRWANRRGPRLFRSEKADSAMASLAQRSQSKRVLNASQVQYTIRRGEAITEIVYDRRIGGVVRSVVTDPTLGVITTQSTYESVAGGSVLVSQEVSVRAKGVERTTRNVFGRGQLAGGTR